MQTIYGRGRGTKRGDKDRTQHGNRRQLMQLLVCLVVFLAVFIGKGIWPSKVAQTGTQLLAVIRANTDFRAVFASLGQALAEQESVLGELGELCVSVFAPATDEPSRPAEEDQEVVPQPELPEQSEPQPALQVGDVVGEVELSQTFPEGYSGQWLFLGEMETAVPVMGRVSSGFGYRDHPSTGRHAVHGGVDIAADQGTPVAAFASGTVESVGEDSDYGKYLYLTHPNGVTTFYAHCSKLCVKQGEQVQAGQTVAQVGSTGKSTGAHLHFEVRLDGVRLDPMYYIASQPEV